MFAFIGMLGKSSGQTLRVATCLNVLFKTSMQGDENDKKNDTEQYDKSSEMRSLMMQY